MAPWPSRQPRSHLVSGHTLPLRSTARPCVWSSTAPKLRPAQSWRSHPRTPRHLVASAVGVSGMSLSLALLHVARTCATSPCANAPLAAWLWLAMSSDKPQLGFHGFIAEVRAWDRALPPTELASQGRLRLRGCEPGLLGCWSMQSVDHLIVDRSPFCNHGLVVRFALRDCVSRWRVLEAA